MNSTLLVLGLIAAVLVAMELGKIFGYKESADPLPDTFWGPKDQEGEKQDPSIHYFSVKVEDKVIQNLREKLKEELNSGRFTPPLEGTGFDYGFNHDYLKTVLGYWLNKYDWKAREALLNKYPSFKVKVSGLNIHFQMIRSASTGSGKYKKTRPLLLLHGWPGSFVEFQKIIPKLTDPKDSEINFDLIIPSLPGYGFSDGAAKPGLGIAQMAQVMQKLMNRLGYPKYYVQGGDWGAIIGDAMAKMYPDNVVALHSNMCGSDHPRSFVKLFLASFFPSWFFDADELKHIAPMSHFWKYMIRETGYAHIQATKPDTVSAGLLHSPTGLAAYILEKFSTWTNVGGIPKQDGGLTNKFNLDELLDNVMIYWVTNSMTTSMRLYSEGFSPANPSVPTKIPVGCLVPRFESFIGHSKSMLKDSHHNLLSYTLAPDGGHFFAMEHPDVLAQDFIPFIKKVESSFKSDPFESTGK